MSGKIRAGLLPLYLLMHDEVFPERRAEAQGYLDHVTRWLTGLGVEVTAAPVCRLRPEFEAAAELLNGADLDAVITLHLVYSPSLESIDAIRSLNAPLVVLDTTPDNDFGERPSPRGIRPNIGIHGVQDLCSLLTRFGVPFAIAAGHLSDPRVGERLLTALLAARAAKALRTARVGRIGGVYPGMGDFTVPDQRLSEELGMQVVDFAPGDARPPVGDGDPALQPELMEDRRGFELCCEQDADYLAAAARGLRSAAGSGGRGSRHSPPISWGPAPPACPGCPFWRLRKPWRGASATPGRGTC